MDRRELISGRAFGDWDFQPVAVDQTGAEASPVPDVAQEAEAGEAAQLQLSESDLRVEIADRADPHKYQLQRAMRQILRVNVRTVEPESGTGKYGAAPSFTDELLGLSEAASKIRDALDGMSDEQLATALFDAIQRDARQAPQQLPGLDSTFRHGKHGVAQWSPSHKEF